MNSYSLNTEMAGSDLQGMTVSALRSLAASRGYSISKTKKADIISEIQNQEESI